MSKLSKLTGIHLNLKPVAPLIGAALGSVVPGVGTAIGAGLGRTLSGLGDHESLGHALGQGALAGAAGGVGGKLLGAVKAIPGVSSLPGMTSVGNFLGGAKSAVGNVLSKIPGEQAAVGKLGSIASTVKGAVGGAARAANGGKPITLGTLGSALKGGVGALAAHPELAAAGLSGVAGYRDAKRGGQLENDAINTMRSAYQSLDPSKPHEDLSALFSDPGNPYVQAKKIRLATA